MPDYRVVWPMTAFLLCAVVQQWASDSVVTWGFRIWGLWGLLSMRPSLSWSQLAGPEAGARCFPAERRASAPSKPKKAGLKPQQGHATDWPRPYFHFHLRCLFYLAQPFTAKKYPDITFLASEFPPLQGVRTGIIATHHINC